MMLKVEEDVLETLVKAKTDNQERKTLWRCLSAYDLTNSYEEFCAWLRIKDNQEAEDLYATTHMAFITIWREHGWEKLQTMIRIGWQGLYLNDRRLT
jgi:hypothetical protein